MASNNSHSVNVTMNITLTSVPMISALCHPKVNSFDASLRDIFIAAIEIIKPTTSVAKCAVSVNMAIELAKYPPMHYKTIKTLETHVTHTNLLNALSYVSASLSSFDFLLDNSLVSSFLTSLLSLSSSPWST